MLQFNMIFLIQVQLPRPKRSTAAGNPPSWCECAGSFFWCSVKAVKIGNFPMKECKKIS